MVKMLATHSKTISSSRNLVYAFNYPGKYLHTLYTAQCLSDALFSFEALLTIGEFQY